MPTALKIAVALLALFSVAPQQLRADEVVVVSLAPADGNFRSAFSDFKTITERDFGPDTQVTLLIDGQVGSEESMVSTLRRGRADYGVLTIPGTSTAVPELTLLMAPYLFDSFEEADFVLDNYLVAPVAELFAERGLIFIQWVDSGWWNLFATKPIRLPEDTHAVRMRAAGGDAAVLFLKAIGADVIPLPFAEVIPGLQTGLIDGGATNTAMYAAVGMYEHAPYLMMTRHALNPGIVMANKRWFERLGSEQQAVIRTALGTSAHLRRIVREEEQQGITLIRELGIEPIELSAPELDRWRAAARPVHEALIERLGGASRQLYERIQEGRAAFAATFKKIPVAPSTNR